jgi:hypothetical protein
MDLRSYSRWYDYSAHRDIRLPQRQPPGGYVQPDLPLRHIPARF